MKKIPCRHNSAEINCITFETAHGIFISQCQRLNWKDRFTFLYEKFNEFIDTPQIESAFFIDTYIDTVVALDYPCYICNLKKTSIKASSCGGRGSTITRTSGSGTQREFQ